MRTIGHVPGESEALKFSDYLSVQGIESMVEPERDGRWVVWVHQEDEIPRAQGFLQQFLATPKARVFDDASTEAKRRLREQKNVEKQAAKRTFDADDLFHRQLILGMTVTTAVLVGISVGVWLLSQVPSIKPSLQRALHISKFLIGNTPMDRLRDGLVEIRHGEIWRLITPIFLHFHILHIFFNMLWLKDLGTLIEMRLGRNYLLALVAGTGVISNLGQYYLAGPAFGGMSGVVYGLLGYIWMRGKFDPDSGLFLHPTTVVMMLIWLCFGFTGAMAIANGAHTIGLASGMVWGIISAQIRR
ncbi:MAG: rhomboid family intramembrane serine protease [Pedosphaera sp.]|nr:rhomboid family intramembrane serine protease [Pedosphaera sp.]